MNCEMTNFKIAQQYLEKERKVGIDDGGLVVIFKGAAAGWMSALRDPHKWRPGCIAVDDDGNEWIARGGNSYDGAERWEAVTKVE